jgi:simple sugar transport system substrate-binding protein
MDRRKFAASTLGAALATPLLSATAKAETKYTFYHLLWGMTDANVQIHIKAGEAYMTSHPEVVVKYVGPEKYDPAEHAKFLDTILAAKPDGVALHISSVDALLPGLKKAKEMGVPVVSVTSHPPSAEDNEKLKGLFLTWVGANEQLIGGVLGARLLQSIKPVHVAYLMSHLGHAGHEMRAKGFFESMPQGVKTEKVAIGEEPEQAKDVIRSYLTANPDVNALFGSAPANKWVADVLQELGRTDIAVLTSDESPTSLECVLQDKCLATFSQEFPIQAPFGYEVLYNYNKTKMWPVQPIVTGPMVVDKSNAQLFKDAAVSIFGETDYNKLSPF